MYMNFDFISDEEEEIMEEVPQPRKQRTFRARVDHFQKWDDQEFFMRFRLKKETVQEIHDMIEPQIRSSKRSHAMTPMDRLLMTLRFFATGCHLIAAGDFAGVHKSTALKWIWKVTRALVQLRPQFIYMPRTQQEMTAIQAKFFDMAKFPRVVGLVDCTHIRIQSIGGQDAENFRNRKKYFSKNVQVVGGPSLEVMDIVTRWPGATHDQTIFNASTVVHRLAAGEWGRNYILADSGYECRPYCLIPIENVTIQAQQLYNESLIRTRQSVERLFGTWKRRFPILSLGIRVTEDTSEKADYYIVACAILQNIAVRKNEEVPPADPEVFVPPYNPNDYEVHVPLANRNDKYAVRTAVINDYFATLV